MAHAPPSRLNDDTEIPAAWDAETRRLEAPLPPPAPPLEIEERTTARAIPRYARTAQPDDEPTHYECEGCGVRVRQNAVGHEVVTRIVRLGQRVGDKAGGEVIYIEPRDLAGPLLASTCSVSEWRAYEVARATPRAEPQKGRLAQMVDQMLPGVRAQTRSLIEAGKERLSRDAARAERTANETLGAESPSTGDRLASVLESFSDRLAAIEKKVGIK